MKIKRVIPKISYWFVVFLIIGCSNTESQNITLLDKIKDYSGSNNELKEIIFDYSAISKNDESINGFRELLKELSDFVDEYYPDLKYNFIEKRESGEVYCIQSTTDKSKRRFILTKGEKMISPMCFAKGDEVTFCYEWSENESDKQKR